MSAATDRNRADQVRQRRRQQTNRRLSESAVRATRPLTPITARNSTAPARPASSAARHNQQTAVSMPGVVIQLPAVSFTGPQVKRRLLSVTLSVALGAAIYMLWTAPNLQVGAPAITGNLRLDTAEIRSVLGIQAQPIFTVEPLKLERRLRLSFPELVSASVKVEFPNRVVVEVSERSPVVLWEQGGSYTWIDANGVAFRPHGQADNLIRVQALTAPGNWTAPTADPLSPKPFLSREMISAIKALAGAAPAGAPILFDGRYGLGWADPRGWQAFFGIDSHKMPLRLQVYTAVVQSLVAQGVTPSLINVQFPSAPYYRIN